LIHTQVKKIKAKAVTDTKSASDTAA